MANKVVRVLEFIGGCFFVGLTILVLIQVFMRYVFHSSPMWTEELARYCSIWSVLILGSVSIYEKGHVALDFFVLLLPKGWQKVFSVIDGIIVVIFLACFIYGGWGMVQAALTSGQMTTGSRIPFFLVYMIFPIGGVLMVIAELMHVYADLTDKGEKEGNV